jgi:hypothetical protein
MTLTAKETKKVGPLPNSVGIENRQLVFGGMEIQGERVLELRRLSASQHGFSFLKN